MREEQFAEERRRQYLTEVEASVDDIEAFLERSMGAK